jgi:hypothetical protein
MNKKVQRTDIVIYQTKSGAIEFRGDFCKETIWATLDQIATLFDRDKSVVSRHLKNIFFTNELSHDSVVAKYATTAADGKTYQVEYYNLDAIISVGAYAFVWLLRTTGILDISRITPATLTAITLLIAESNPADKNKMVNLVTMLLTRSS